MDVVIWCVGYEDDTHWMGIEAAYDAAGFVEDHGVSPVPGLYVAGKKWLRCRASELVLGADADAAHVVTELLGYLNQQNVMEYSNEAAARVAP